MALTLKPKPERLAKGNLLFIISRKIVLFGLNNTVVVRVIGLDHNLSRPFPATGPACHLRL